MYAENMSKKFDLTLLPPKPNLAFELTLWDEGINLIAGIDEAGRGAWAGPVYAAAVIFPKDQNLLVSLSGIDDSKKLTPTKRNECACRIKKAALAWQIGSASSIEIDQIGILPATRLAMNRAVLGLSVQPQHLLIDFITLPEIILPQTSIVKGDARSLSIASASILAKTSRDEVMVYLTKDYPGYGFEQHKGYGTAQHQRMITHLGPSPIHRLSFKPLKTYFQ
jgi:ribonuclease HII